VKLRGWAIAIALSGMPLLGAPTSIAHAAPSGTYGKAQIDRSTVGVGDILEYALTVTTTGDAVARSPAPGNIDGFELVGSSTATHQSIVMSQGSLQNTTSVTVTYRLRAETMGVHVLGPGKMFVDGDPVKTPSVTVSVVAAGKAPPPPKKNDPDPFFDDPFFGGGGHDDEPPNVPNVAPVDPMAAVDGLPIDPIERNIFVRLVPNDRRPIIGQQVTTKLFVYTKRHPRISVKRPPAFAEFATIDLGQLDHEWHPITIGGESWAYADIGAFAVFPLKSGSLTMGAAEIEYSEAFSPGSREAQSKEVTVEAIEPPVDGRPPGYVLGDVAAELEMNAEISPREVQDGHALLTLKLRGKGRLEPLRPILPTLPGVTWTSTGDDSKTELDGTAVRGMRKVTYDIAFDRAEAIDLGEAFLHVWDPREKHYATVRTSLGRVRVITAIPASTAGAASPLSQLPPPRRDAGDAGTGSSLADHGWTWGIVFGAPLMVLLAQGATLLTRRAKSRASASRERPESQAEVALREARAAEKKGDRTATMAALARAVDRAVEASTGIRARSLTGAELTRALGERKVDAATSARVTKLLSAIDSARFAGGAAPTTEEATSVIAALPARAELS
jgi:hypothetical protein